MSIIRLLANVCVFHEGPTSFPAPSAQPQFHSARWIEETRLIQKVRHSSCSWVSPAFCIALSALTSWLDLLWDSLLCHMPRTIFNIRSKGALLQEWHTLAQQIPSFIALGTRNKHEQAPSITVNRNKSHPNSKRDLSFRSWMLPIPWGAGFSKPCDGQSQTHVLTWQCISSPHKICCRQPTVCVSEVQN